MARPDARGRERLLRPGVMVARLVLVLFVRAQAGSRRARPPAPRSRRPARATRPAPARERPRASRFPGRRSSVTSPGPSTAANATPASAATRLSTRCRRLGGTAFAPAQPHEPASGCAPQHEPEEAREDQVDARHRHAAGAMPPIGMRAGADGDLDGPDPAGDPVGGRPSHVEERLGGGTGRARAWRLRRRRAARRTGRRWGRARRASRSSRLPARSGVVNRATPPWSRMPAMMLPRAAPRTEPHPRS